MRDYYYEEFKEELVRLLINDLYGEDYSFDIEDQVEYDPFGVVLDLLKHVKYFEDGYKPFSKNER